MKQWPSEVEKFLGKSKNVVVINTIANLNKLTIDDVIKADIVLATKSMFDNIRYYTR